ncbi:Lipolysis-Stimulated Lipoprotein Receptor, partial [Manis pentadactyla]
MHMIRLRREFGFNSDVSPRETLRLTTLKLVATFRANAIQFHDYSEAIVVSMVILEFQATGEVSDPDEGLGLALVDTLALWKDLGSGSDVLIVQDGGSGL